MSTTATAHAETVNEQWDRVEVRSPIGIFLRYAWVPRVEQFADRAKQLRALEEGFVGDEAKLASWLEIYRARQQREAKGVPPFRVVINSIQTCLV